MRSPTPTALTVLTVCAQLAAGAASLRPADLAAMQNDVDELSRLLEIAKKLFTTEGTALQPPAVSEIRGDTRYPYFDRLAQFGSVEALAGQLLEPPIVLPVELSSVPDAVDSLLGASNAMQNAVYACTLLANQVGRHSDHCDNRGHRARCAPIRSAGPRAAARAPPPANQPAKRRGWHMARVAHRPPLLTASPPTALRSPLIPHLSPLTEMPSPLLS